MKIGLSGSNKWNCPYFGRYLNKNLNELELPIKTI